MKSNAVVFVGMVHPWGNVRHFALLGRELFGLCSGIGIDFYYASIEKEVDAGSWQAVRQSIPPRFCISSDDFNGLVQKVDSLFAVHGKVLVHCGGGWGQTKALLPLRRKYGRRLVLVGTTHSYRHDSTLRIPMSAFQSLLYLRYYDKIVFQCRYAADMFWGSRLLFAAGKAAVVPLGCEPFGDAPDETPAGIASRPELAEALLDKALFKFVYLAGFRPGKMHAWLVRALAPMLRENPRVRMLFCGMGDAAVIDSVKAIVAEEGLNRQILLPGQIERRDVQWLLLHCNCAIVPSRAETFGHNFLEPMFAGLPVLGTRVGIGMDIIRDGDTGFGFSLRNPEYAAECAARLVSDPQMTADMGRRAKAFVETRFTHAAVAKDLTSLYRELLSGGANKEKT